MQNNFLYERIPLVKSIYNGLCIHNSLEESIAELDEIRKNYTSSRKSDDEQNSHYEIFWVRGLEVSTTDRNNGFKGHYWKFTVEPLDCKYRLKMERLDIDLKKHPDKFYPKGKHPSANWGHPLLRRIRRDGRRYFKKLEDAKEELKQFKLDFKTTILATETMAYIIVFDKSSKEKPPVQKWVLEIAEDENGPYIFVERNVYKNKNSIKAEEVVVKKDDINEEAIAFSKYLFGSCESDERKIARSILIVMKNRENRRSLKLSEQSVSTNSVFHFTGLSSLEGILSGKSLWLTDLEFVNDVSEIEHGRRKILSYLEEVTSDVSISNCSEKIRKLATSSLEYLDGPKREQIKTYGFSFSESYELSNQWLAYGQSGDGISIGFDRDLLFRISSSDKKMYFSKVHYNDERKKQIVSAVMDELASETISDDLETCTPKLARAFNVLAAFLKHNGFHTEKEWRLTHSGIRMFDVKQRPGKKTGILYIDVGIEEYLNTKVEDLINCVVIGPCEGVETRKREVQLLLQKYDCTGINILTSSLPLYT